MRAIASMVGLLLASCTAAHTPASDATAFLAALDRALCDRMVRCAGAYDTPSDRRRYTASPTCHPSTHYGNLVGADQAVARGEAVFVPSAASTCLSDVATLPCRSTHAPGTPTRILCNAAFRGTAALGSSCDATTPFDACAHGTHCASIDGCGGTCVANASDGETCYRRPCATSGCGVFLGIAYCGAAPTLGQACTGRCVSAAVCRGGVCIAVPVAAAGDACGPNVATCVAGLTCDWPELPSHTQGACRASGSQGLGDPCQINVCAAGLDCIDGRCGVWPGTTTEGGVCASNRDCAPAFGWCLRGRCTTTPPVPCDLQGPPDPLEVSRETCPDGQRCSFADDFCFTAVALHDACSAETQCPDGSRCVDGTCTAVVHPGNACTADALCPAGFACIGSICAALPVFGESCSGRCLDADCVSGTCSRRGDGASCADEPGAYYAWRGRDRSLCEGECSYYDRVCVPRHSLGEPCTWFDDCARGLLCFGGTDDHGHCAPATCGH